jgi:hypothetical protein
MRLNATVYEDVQRVYLRAHPGFISINRGTMQANQ